jgi:phosphonate transport system ATP-binding protein
MPIIRFEQVTHVYPTGRAALQEVTFAIEEGERVGLVGPSGAGKSTLLRAVNGLVAPTRGRVTVLGQEVTALRDAALPALRRQIGMVFQEFALMERLPALTNVLVGRLGYNRALPSILGLFPKADILLAREALERVGLSGYEERPVRRLSGGQKQRVGIARALAQEARIVLGDEPTANLDVRTADETLTLLTGLAESRGVTLLLSLHDVRAARRHCDRILALNEGWLVWDGPAAAFDDAVVEQVFYAQAVQ